MSSPDADFVVDATSRTQHATQWTQTLTPFTDINSGLMTHWHEQQQPASRIDRIYVATPGWLLTCMTVSSITVGDPLAASRRGPSDHVPITLTLARSAPKPRAERPIPAWVCRSPLYAANLSAYTEYLNVTKRHGEDRWLAHKAALREAGLCTRNAMIAGVAEYEAPPVAILSMCARAVWAQDLSATHTHTPRA